MTADTADVDRIGIFVDETRDGGVIVNGVGHRFTPSMTIVARALPSHILVGMTDREIDVPPGSGLLEHLVATATVGGTIYLTRDGQRIAAVVPADVAESIEREPAAGDADGLAGPGRVDALVAELERANGELTQEELDEADREWRAALGR